MESTIRMGREGDESADVREAFAESWAANMESIVDGSVIMRTRSEEVDVKIHGGSPILSRQGSHKTLKVKDLSRLWQYRNGKSPDDKPRVLQNGGVLRGDTM